MVLLRKTYEKTLYSVKAYIDIFENVLRTTYAYVQIMTHLLIILGRMEWFLSLKYISQYLNINIFWVYIYTCSSLQLTALSDAGGRVVICLIEHNIIVCKFNYPDLLI